MSTPEEQKMPVLLLSAGHGAGDPGGMYADYNEHDIAVKVAWYLAGMLSEDSAEVGVEVLAVPAVSLANKIVWVNNKTRDLRTQGRDGLAVELHCNAAEDDFPRGSSVFHYAGNGTTRQMALDLCEVIASRSWPSRGVKTAKDSNVKSLAWLEGTVPWALLIEMGFITNARDRVMLVDPAGQVSIASRLAHGLTNALLYMYSLGTGQRYSHRTDGIRTGGEERGRGWREGDMPREEDYR